tara:strand:+ start:197 stop:469 length:273 start_codon:yes stop_codon:yes gene_type:complete
MANYSEALIVKIKTELMASKSGNYKIKNADFKKLERYQDGSIVNLSSIFYLLTKSQINRLTGDDQSRYEDYDEELRCMMHDAEEEFKAYS